MPKRSWLEFDDIILFVIYYINIRNVEFTWFEFSHEFSAVKSIRIINPSTFFIENRWFQSTLGEVSLRNCWISLFIIFLSRKERVLDLSVINSWTNLFRAIWECKLGIATVVTVLTTISLITFTFDIFDVIEASPRLGSPMRITNCLAHMILINDALNMSIFQSFCLFEAFLTRLAVLTGIWIRAYAVSILRQWRQRVRIAFLCCLLIVGLLAFKTVLSFFGLPYILHSFWLFCWAFQTVASVIMWYFGFVREVEVKSQSWSFFFGGSNWVNDIRVILLVV